MSRILRLWATTGLIAATVLTALVFAVAGSAGQQQSGPLVIGGEQIASAQLYELAKREGRKRVIALSGLLAALAG